MSNEEIIEILYDIKKEKIDTEFKIDLLIKLGNNSDKLKDLLILAHKDLIDVQKMIVYFGNVKNKPTALDIKNIKAMQNVSESIKLLIGSFFE